jgi:hypothetical protein
MEEGTMHCQRILSLATVVALVASLLLTAVAGANPPAPGDSSAQPTADLTVGPRSTNLGKTIDQPNPNDYWRNRERQRLLSKGEDLNAQSLAVTADDRVLVVLVEFAGTDTFTWKPGDQWDPYGRADTAEACSIPMGNVDRRRLLQHHHRDEDLHLQRTPAQSDPAARLGDGSLRRHDLD